MQSLRQKDSINQTIFYTCYSSSFLPTHPHPPPDLALLWFTASTVVLSIRRDHSEQANRGGKAGKSSCRYLTHHLSPHHWIVRYCQNWLKPRPTNAEPELMTACLHPWHARIRNGLCILSSYFPPTHPPLPKRPALSKANYIVLVVVLKETMTAQRWTQSCVRTSCARIL